MLFGNTFTHSRLQNEITQRNFPKTHDFSLKLKCEADRRLTLKQMEAQNISRIHKSAFGVTFYAGDSSDQSQAMARASGLIVFPVFPSNMQM